MLIQHAAGQFGLMCQSAAKTNRAAPVAWTKQTDHLIIIQRENLLQRQTLLEAAHPTVQEEQGPPLTTHSGFDDTALGRDQVAAATKPGKRAALVSLYVTTYRYQGRSYHQGDEPMQPVTTRFF
jgi:hypothetical protein